MSKIKSFENQKFENGLLTWYVDKVIINRKTWFLLTNSSNLYSFLLKMGTKRERELFESFFLKKLEDKLFLEGLETRAIMDSIGKEASQILYAKTNSKRILGSMNDHKKSIVFYKAYYDLSVSDIEHKLNETPMTYEGESIYPKEVFRKQMEELLHS